MNEDSWLVMPPIDHETHLALHALDVVSIVVVAVALAIALLGR